jgi:hypothetical protein
MKLCRVCGLTRPLESFYRDRTRRDGRMRLCKDCERLRERTRDRREHHRRKFERRKARKLAEAAVTNG